MPRFGIENRAVLSIGGGLALTAAALTGRVTIGDSSAEFAAVAAREATLERSVSGMPRPRDILTARTVLRPEVPNSQLPDYYGDSISCSDNNKRDFEMVAAACSVLAKARSRIEAVTKLKANDTELASLRSALDTKSKLGLALTGVAAAALGATMLYAFVNSGLLNRREVQEAA